MINWTVRLKNKNFWLALIPAILLLAQAVAAVFGYALDFGELTDKLIAVVNAIFTVLVILGIVADPTTEEFILKNRNFAHIYNSFYVIS